MRLTARRAYGTYRPTLVSRRFSRRRIPADWLEQGELEFERWVVKTARLGGWHGIHIRDSEGALAGVQKGDAFGWPDWVFWNASSGRIIFRELKTTKGRLMQAQAERLFELVDCGQDAKVWRPADHEEIVATFSGLER